MSLETGYNRRKKLYTEHLSLCENIKFTVREIDVMTCLLHNRGEKKIAFLLSISPRTVGAHIRNIMLKLGNSSRENIIDFIEKSGKLLFFREYYLQLLIQSAFQNQLVKIAKNLNKEQIKYYFTNNNISEADRSVLDQLIEHLKLANILLQDSLSLSSSNKKYIYLITNELFSNQKQFNGILILLNKNTNCDLYKDTQYLDFTNDDEYYLKIFELLKIISPQNSFDYYIQEFSKEFEAIKNSWNGISIKDNTLSVSVSFLNKIRGRKFTFIIILISSLTILLIILPLAQNFFHSETLVHSTRISSDLPLPNGPILLERSAILKQIDEKFASNRGIQVVALVGTGGCGKTVIARRYARNQKLPIVWEINAETKESMIFSFEQLAYLMCANEEEKRELGIIQEIKTSFELEERLLLFIKKRIKLYPTWLIIFNNVKTFKDIRKYFPHDPEVWGNGKVLITTCDSNIAHNCYIPITNIINVGELNKEEKLELFTKIVNNNKAYAIEQRAIELEVLEKVPPFPLDVSLAAYYLRDGKIPYDEYLRNISEPQEDFDSVQEIIINDIGEYTKTRFDIIKLSLMQFLNEPGFVDLLLFISMIDSQNILKDLLVLYKGEVIVSKFIHELRKFSLISESEALNDNVALTFSLHRSTQTIMLAYLKKLLKFDKNTKQLEEIAIIFTNYLDKELDLGKSLRLPLLVSHAEIFLNHNQSLEKKIQSGLNTQLGIYYFQIGNYEKAKDLFNKSYHFYDEYYGIDNVNTAKVAAYLGIAHRNMGNYKIAKKLLEQAYLVYRTVYSIDHPAIIRVSTYLGSVYRNIGEYKQAEELLSQAYNAYRKNYGDDSINTAWAAAYLGSVYNNIGKYKAAEELLNQAFKVYKHYYGLDHTKYAWILVRQAILLGNLGDYKKAKEYMEIALMIYQKHYGKNCIETAWVLTHLGHIYNNLGNEVKAYKSLNDSLSIYNHLNIGNNHIITSWTFQNLGNVYYKQGDYEKAKSYAEKSLEIYKLFYGKNHVKNVSLLLDLGGISLAQDDLESCDSYLKSAIEIFSVESHTDSYACLELQSDLSLKKYAKEKNSKLKALYKTEAEQNLNKAIRLIDSYFKMSNPHTKRLQLKLKMVKELR